MTIEQRASKFTDEMCEEYRQNRLEVIMDISYYTGAKEQRDIDIERGWHYVWELLISKGASGVEISEEREKFLKVME